MPLLNCGMLSSKHSARSSEVWWHFVNDAQDCSIAVLILKHMMSSGYAAVVKYVMLPERKGYANFLSNLQNQFSIINTVKRYTVHM